MTHYNVSRSRIAEVRFPSKCSVPLLNHCAAAYFTDVVSQPACVVAAKRLRCCQIPRIDEFDAGVNEVTDVARRESGVPVAANCSDLPIGHTDLESATLPFSNDICIMSCSQRIEWQNPVLEILRQQSVDLCAKLTSASPVRQSGDAVHQFGRRHGSQQYVGHIQTVDPTSDTRFRCWAHQLRNHVGIQDDHSSRTAARGRSVRPGRSSSTPPVPEKRCRIRVAIPGPPTGRCNAVRKISRTSDSIDRPCSAARTRSAALSSSSKSRIVNVAISHPLPIDCIAVNASSLSTFGAIFTPANSAHGYWGRT